MPYLAPNATGVRLERPHRTLLAASPLSCSVDLIWFSFSSLFSPIRTFLMVAGDCYRLFLHAARARFDLISNAFLTLTY